MATLNKDIFFYHVMKTAGTTVVRLLEQAYGADASCPLPTHESADPQPFFGKVSSPTPLIISGHPDQLFDLWKLAEQRSLPRAKMTFLRHPVDRYLSCYYFIRRSHYVQKHVGSFDLDLEQALSCDDRRLAGNMMTKVLSSLGTARDYREPATKQDLLQAVENLKAMDFIGLVEEFDLSYALLAHEFGFVPPCVTKWNVNAKYEGRNEISPKLERQIRIKNLFDYELYQFAVELFRARVVEAGEDLAQLLTQIKTSDRVYMVKQQT
ncbi:MAG: sulfotransferase family protein [Dehalobacter sp.]|nr:sulfotransferase family protein [Dehalobacter sp.]